MIIDNKSKAEKFLEKIQLENLEMLGIDIQELDKTLFEAKVEDPYIQECLDISIENRSSVVLSSPYEWNLGRQILQSAVDAINLPEISSFLKEKYKDLNISRQEFPYWGTVMSLDVSATYYGTNIDRDLITISYAACDAAYTLSLIIGNMIFDDITILTSYSKMVQYTKKVPEIKLLLFDFFYCDSYYGHVLFADHGNLNGNSIVQYICDMFELFIVAHEYAHFIYGHTPISAVVSNLSKDSLKTLLYRRYKQELEADEMAVTICKRFCQVKKIPPVLCDLGIHLFFIYLELHEKSVAYKPYKDTAILTHPRADGRKYSIICTHLSEYYSFMGKELDRFINYIAQQYTKKLESFRRTYGSNTTHDVIRKYLLTDDQS